MCSQNSKPGMKSTVYRTGLLAFSKRRRVPEVESWSNSLCAARRHGVSSPARHSATVKALGTASIHGGSQSHASQSQAVRTAAGRRTTAYDGLGRVAVTAPDGSVTETRYTGPLTLALDASAQHKTRQSTGDALGRLTQVVENQTTWNGQAVGVAAEPVLTTTYSYDALDDLLPVAQGTQSRTFIYDSLKRLVEGIRQSNPTLYAERD